MTTTASPTTLSDDALEALRAELHGAAIRPTDADYDEVRNPFNAMHGGRPEVAIRCMGAADVVAGVNFAREHGLDLAVRGGGHFDRRPVGA
jgi:FAD/FMN-containing dehydrogenase